MKPVQPQPQLRLQKRKAALPLRNKRKKNLCAFIDDEAGVSGNDSSDEDMDDLMTQEFDQTVDIEDGDPNVDMQAKYLQSVRYVVTYYRHCRRQIKTKLIYKKPKFDFTEAQNMHVSAYHRLDTEIQLRRPIFSRNMLHQM